LAKKGKKTCVSPKYFVITVTPSGLRQQDLTGRPSGPQPGSASRIFVSGKNDNTDSRTFPFSGRQMEIGFTNFFREKERC